MKHARLAIMFFVVVLSLFAVASTALAENGSIVYTVSNVVLH